MFIPRTLAQDDPRAGRGLGRALIVTVLVALALFLCCRRTSPSARRTWRSGRSPRATSVPARRDVHVGEPHRGVAGAGRRRGRARHRDDQVADRQPGGPAPRLRHDGPAGCARARAARPRARSRARRSSTDWRTTRRSSRSPGGSRWPRSTPVRWEAISAAGRTARRDDPGRSDPRGRPVRGSHPRAATSSRPTSRAPSASWPARWRPRTSRRPRSPTRRRPPSRSPRPGPRCRRSR